MFSTAYRRCRSYTVLAAMSAGVFLGNPLNAKAELDIRSSASRTAMWRRVYDRMPGVWKTRRRLVVDEVPRDVMEQLVSRLRTASSEHTDRKFVADGCFQPRKQDEEADIITLRNDVSGQNAEMIFTHEYGHFVWYNLMNTEQRLRYRRLWRDLRDGKHLITAYAATSAEEGFAESFAYYIQKRTRLRHHDAASDAFLEELLHTREQLLSVADSVRAQALSLCATLVLP